MVKVKVMPHSHGFQGHSLTLSRSREHFLETSGDLVSWSLAKEHRILEENGGPRHSGETDS